jgi:hypothetical protein
LSDKIIEFHWSDRQCFPYFKMKETEALPAIFQFLRKTGTGLQTNTRWDAREFTDLGGAEQVECALGR